MSSKKRLDLNFKAFGYPNLYKDLPLNSFHLQKYYQDEITGERKNYMPFCSMACINGAAFPGDIVRIRKSRIFYRQEATNCMAVKEQAFASKVEITPDWQEALYLGLDITRSYLLHDFTNNLKLANGVDYTGFLAVHFNLSHFIELELIKCNQETMQTMWREPEVAITGAVEPPAVGYAPYVQMVGNFYYLPKTGLSTQAHKKRHIEVDYYFKQVNKIRNG